MSENELVMPPVFVEKFVVFLTFAFAFAMNMFLVSIFQLIG